ncbi:SMI1/KNR4 family protein [Gimesia maris]|uniref:SMI1/KNR4 family protein n=1 Tax=Gimesia maris TaxID=122 RepID=UPI0030D88590
MLIITIMTLQQILTAIDELIPAYEFSDAASAEELDYFGNQINVISGTVLPEQLIIWFSWHNGQTTSNSLLPDENWKLLNIDEALQAWNYFLDPRNEFLEPYDCNWLPLFSNGSSDYLVFDLNTGNLILYWHDDPERNIEFASLSQWALFVKETLSSRIAENSTASVLIEQERPEALIISVSPAKSMKHLQLAREIHQITGFSLMEVVRKLSDNSMDSELIWELSTAVNSLDRSQMVKTAMQVVRAMQSCDIVPVLEIKSKTGQLEVINYADLERLQLKCLTC